VPCGHWLHVADATVLYVPGIHAEQLTEAGGEYEPAGHWIHAVELVAPAATEYVPPTQGVHV